MDEEKDEAAQLVKMRNPQTSYRDLLRFALVVASYPLSLEFDSGNIKLVDEIQHNDTVIRRARRLVGFNPRGNK